MWIKSASVVLIVVVNAKVKGVMLDLSRDCCLRIVFDIRVFSMLVALVVIFDFQMASK